MKRSLLLVPMLALALVACRKSETAPTNASCDLAALDALAKQLATADPAAQADRVWPALGEACEDLPPFARAFFESTAPRDEDEPTRRLFPPLDDASKALRFAACPDLEVTMRAVADASADERTTILFEGCDFERFGIVTLDQAKGDALTVTTWIVHQWMLDAGVPERDAQVISRAVYALEQLASSPFGRYRDLDVPRASGVPIRDGTPVVISRRELRFIDQRVAVLDAGRLPEPVVRDHLIVPLYDQFVEEVEKLEQIYESRDEAWDERLIIMADADTPFETIVNVMFTGGRAEFHRYGFVVSNSGYDRAMIPVSPPRYEAPQIRHAGIYAMKGPKDAIPQMARNFDPDMAGRVPESPGVLVQVMSIELTTEGMSLGRGGRGEEQPVAHPRGATEAITAYAEAIKGESPEATEVAISADGDVPLQDVLSAIAAARGVLPEVVIMSGRAHTYRPPPSYAIGNDDEALWGELTGTEVGEATGGTIGLGNTGLIGDSNFSERSAHVPRVRAAKAEVSGSLDSDVVRRVVRAHINEVRACYNLGLAKDPELAGRVTIDFTIGPTGSVGAAKVRDSNLDDEAVGTCIAKAVGRWTFPKPRSGSVSVVYPFNLEPG